MDKALSFFHKAIQRDENLADAWYAIALILDFQSRDMEAKYYIKKALELNADNVDYWFTYAEIQEKIGFIEEAEIAYKKVIELENFEPEIWLNYSNLLYQHQHQKRLLMFYTKESSITLKVLILFIDYLHTFSIKEMTAKRLLTFKMP